MQNQELWPEPHRRNASCGRPGSISIYKDPPRTRQRTLILAAFLPWGGSDDTVTRRTGPQHTRFHPTRAAAAKRSTSPQACAPTTCHGAGAQYQGRAWLRCSWAAAGPGRASRRRAEPHVERAPPVWRASEGSAAVPVCGGAWPGFETTHRAKLAARTARGRAAAHRHTQRPGPSSQATRRPEHQRRHTQQKPRNLKRSRGPVAEDGGFEPPRACTQHAFQACAIGH